MGASPAKKLNFEPIDKENNPTTAVATENVDDFKKPVMDNAREVKPVVAPTIKEIEADEPLLQENPHRFVLFPIKYHEVRLGRVTRKVGLEARLNPWNRSGKCTKKRRPRSGQLKR